MAELWPFAQRICRELGSGTPVLQGDAVSLVDCPMWSARASAALAAEHPGATLSVQPATYSLSGFTLTLAPPKKKEVERRWSKRRIALLVGVLCLLLLYWAPSLAQRCLLWWAPLSSLCSWFPIDGLWDLDFDAAL